VILTSYEADFAAQWGRKVRRSVTEHYPIIGARIVEDSRAAHRWETREGGGMTTAGVGGPITGRGASILICDDPIKNAEEANSQVLRDNLWDWWTSTFLTRMEPDHRGNPPIVILIQTRWHENDLAGRLMAAPEFKFWEHLDFPAFSLGPELDPLGRPEGAALWPEKFDEVALEGMKARVGSRVFAALYQQNPTPPEGAAIHRAWWHWYDETDRPKLEDFEQIIQSWDTTFKETDSSDFVAGGVIGRIQNRFYVLECRHERLNGPNTLKAIYKMDEQYPQAKWAVIEDSASGSMILDILERERGHVTRGKTKGRSKDVRLHWGVNSVAAIIERGQVFLPRDRSWATKLVDEAAAFPHGAHDDLVDMLVQGIEHLMPKAWLAENMMARLAKEVAPGDLWAQMSRALHGKIHKRLKDLRGQKGASGFPGL
jgi:predicted phage terminase large subunit-like protein